MPQTQGGGTVFTGGPGTSMRGPLWMKPGPGSVSGVTPAPVQLFDAFGNLWAPDGSSFLSAVTVAISSAQIEALFATPVTLVAAQGVGTFIEPISVLFEGLGVTTQYTVSGSAAYALSLSGVITVSGANFNAGFGDVLTHMSNSVSKRLLLEQCANDQSTSNSVNQLSNQPFQLLNGANHDATVGDGTLIAQVTYRVHLIK